MNKFASSLAERSVQKHLETYFGTHPSLICGVSGGVDSMVLLHLLHRAGAQVTVVHVNYQKRGEDSELDQQLVEEICRLYKVECVSVRFDASDSTGNFQAWAREKRYGVFRDLKREFRADAIATAHHRDDQVETIYQRLMRGSGMEHWGGMQVYEQGLFRPLLELGKEDIQMVAEQNGILYRTDVSNLDVAYGRNFIRLSLEPELDRFFPGWKTNLLGLGQRAREFEAMRDR
ncbi:MAG: tRNA lysidine(34) synthetase TilS, partial [Balneolaceae bacterium]